MIGLVIVTVMLAVTFALVVRACPKGDRIDLWSAHDPRNGEPRA